MVSAALILDDMRLAKWQADALANAMPHLDIKVVLSCGNTQSKKSLSKNFLYYLLNVLSLKHSFTKTSPYAVTTEHVVKFDSVYKGVWQSIPKAASDTLEAKGVSVVIKFGMGLLRIDDGLDQYDILSFHHGDPSKYRGRPAGFYEILNRERTLGVIVQKLSNTLDAGRVLAFCEAKIVSHSYKQTSKNFYSVSKFLLTKALMNLEGNHSLEISSDGKNYKLPSNRVVLRFAQILTASFMKRVLYGAFYEKRWNVALASQTLNLDASNIIKAEGLRQIPIKDGYNFYADPFFSNDHQSIRLEALDSRTGLGDIIEVSCSQLDDQSTLLSGKHYSYPFSFSYEDNQFLLPEVASHSAQYYYSLNDENMTKIFIKGLEHKRIVDATLVQNDGLWFLFFGENTDAHSVLHLWVSPELNATFTQHPNSPICISPGHARMAGRVVSRGGKNYRFGQNNEAGYGESITISEITELSNNTYSERVCGSVSMDTLKGPHSLDLDVNGDQILLDYYEDTFSWFAGIRRITARLYKK